jgi:hypothetical protein
LNWAGLVEFLENWMKRLFLLAGIVFPVAAHAFEVRGEVKDTLGRPVPAARIGLQNARGRVIGKTTAASDGSFHFHKVPAGIYAVLAKKKGFSVGTAIVMVKSGTAMASITLAAHKALEVSVVETRIARTASIDGSSVYRMDHAEIKSLPQGENTQLNDVLLRAPGVVQDSFGQIHVRGDHADLQYRINGIMLPEGISGFGQTLDTRFAESIDLLTGVLPSQYGYRTAGVVDIHTKNGAFQKGGSLNLYGGSHNTFEPSIQYGGSSGKLNYYLSASFLQNDLGIQGHTAAYNPLHDRTRQAKGFGYLSYLANPTTSLNLILGSSESRFQIPNAPNLPQQYQLAGVPNYPSTSINDNQTEINHYGILALKKSEGAKTDYQISLFSRYSSVLYNPDPYGDLIYNGVASTVLRSNFANGVQGDGSYRLSAAHTLHAGFFTSVEHAVSDNTSAVFPGSPGNQTSASPFSIVDNYSKTASLYGAYLNDEWHPSSKLTVNYGARFDVMNAYVNADQLSPRIGLVYKATKQTTFHAGYARYFTPPATELIAPTSIAKFQNTTNALPTNVNTSVLPERSHYFDAGVTHQFSPALNLGIDGYYRLVQDLLDEGQFGQALVFSPFNYQQGKIYGLEFTGNYRKGEFSAYLNLAVSRAMGKNIVSGQYNFSASELAYIANNWVHLDHDQTYTGSTGMSYFWRGTNYSMDMLLASGMRRGFANTSSMPGYGQVNLAATRKLFLPWLGRVEGRFAVINLFNHIYEIRDGSGIGVGAPQFGPPRGIYMGVSKGF